MRLEAQFKGGYYPTPPRVLEMIAKLLHPDRYGKGPKTDGDKPVCRLLDPCCGTGEALANIADLVTERGQAGGTALQTYGVELHQGRAQEAAEILDRILASDLFATSIANGVFSVLYLNPPYDDDQEDKRVEHAFLTHCTRYLAMGGILVYIVPRRRLAVSARYLATNYHDVRCWTFPEPESEVYDQVVLMGCRNANSRQDEFLRKQILDWANPNQSTLDPLNLRDFAGYYAPLVSGGPVQFNLRTVEPAVAAAEAQRSGLWTDPEMKDVLWPEVQVRPRPLMPLKRGHMAMLTAAGFLDNLVLQGSSGERVLVKGRTTKEAVVVEETEEALVTREVMRASIMSLDLDTGHLEEVTG